MKASRRDFLLMGGVSGAAVVSGTQSGSAALGLFNSGPAAPLIGGTEEYWIDASNLEEFEDLDPAIEMPIVNSVEFSRKNEEEYWRNFKLKASEYCKLTSDNKISGDLLSNSMLVENGFSFSEEPEDEDLSKFHVETLLDQAADLLERCVSERQTYQELVEKHTLVCLELGEYFDLDDIHIEEERLGYYEHQASKAESEYRADARTVMLEKGIFGTIKDHKETYYNEERIKEQEFNEGNAGYISGKAAYTFDGKSPTYRFYQVKNASKDVASHFKDFAVNRTRYQLEVQKGALSIQEKAHLAEAALASTRLTGSRDVSNWKQHEKEFNKRRTIVSRKYQDIKSRMVSEANGALNLTGYIEASRKRFQQDFRHGYARMIRAQQGLREIYLKDTDIPMPEGSPDVFDQCLIWVREQIQWLIRFTTKDQSMVLPISVRKLAGEEGWGKIKTGGIGDFELPYDEYLSGMSHIRLQGFSASITESHEEMVLRRLTIRPPTIGRAIDRTGRDSKHEIDQSAVPNITAARVTKRNLYRGADLLGASAAHNLSPIGIWKIRIDSDTIGDVDRESVEDIVLDIHISFRSVQGSELQ